VSVTMFIEVIILIRRIIEVVWMEFNIKIIDHLNDIIRLDSDT
jgi:hypothetical protein